MNRQRINESRNTLSTGTGSTTQIEDDLTSVIKGLKENLSTKQVDIPFLPKYELDRDDIRTELDKVGINITNAVNKDGEKIKGQFNISAPGLRLKEIRGVRNKDLTNLDSLFKKLIFSQTGINEKQQKDIYNRLKTQLKF